MEIRANNAQTMLPLVFGLIHEMAMSFEAEASAANRPTASIFSGPIPSCSLQDRRKVRAETPSAEQISAMRRARPG
jgi:hypothetical protein